MVSSHRLQVSVLCATPVIMATKKKRSRGKAVSKARRKTSPGQLSKVKLKQMVREATVDAHDEDEAVMGIYTMLEEHLELPFETKVLGMDVTVEKLNLNDSNDIIVVCRRGKHRQALPILDLPLPSPPPPGWEWIEAYRYWV